LSNNARAERKFKLASTNTKNHSWHTVAMVLTYYSESSTAKWLHAFNTMDALQRTDMFTFTALPVSNPGKHATQCWHPLKFLPSLEAPRVCTSNIEHSKW
jgi:hypothetical protein